MQEANIPILFVSRLRQVTSEYMITGSIASIVYGEPRLTHDVDIVVILTLKDIPKLQNQFPKEEFYLPPSEVLLTEFNRSSRGHFNIIHQITGLKADIYLSGNDPLHEWAMSKRTKVKIEGMDLWIAPPEYVIIRKLEYYEEGRSEKHIRDIKSIFLTSGDLIEVSVIKEKLTSEFLNDQFNQILSSVSE